MDFDLIFPLTETRGVAAEPTDTDSSSISKILGSWTDTSETTLAKTQRGEEKNNCTYFHR